MSNKNTSEKELARLCKQQSKARRDEIFGGFTTSERAAYEARGRRIQVLEGEIFESRRKESEIQTRAAKQRSEWNRPSEPDTPQREARQVYRSRERDSSKAYGDSQKKLRTKKINSDPSPEN